MAEPNNWFEQLVKNYLFYFGKTRKPVIAFMSGRPDALVRAAKRIYDDEDIWFESDLVLVKLPDEDAPQIDILQLTAEEADSIDIPKRTKMLIVIGKPSKNELFNKGYQNIFSDSITELWVSQKTRHG